MGLGGVCIYAWLNVHGCPFSCLGCSLSGEGPWIEEEAAVALTSVSFTFCPGHLPCFHSPVPRLALLCFSLSPLLPCHAVCLCGCPLTSRTSCLSFPASLLPPFPLLPLVAPVTECSLPLCVLTDCSEVLPVHKGWRASSCCQLPAIAGGSHGPLSACLDLLFAKSGESV